MPAFSVVMATYDRGRHILPSVRSVLNQSFQDFELIVVGDCCTDETADILRPYLSAQVRWHNRLERCGSQSFPNNDGIARSSGSHIAYIGHDDIWQPDHLGQLADLFANNPTLDFGVSGAIYHGPPDSDFRIVTGLFTDERAQFEHFFPPSSFAHRRDVTNRIGQWAHPQEVRAPVDADFLLRAANDGMSFASTGEISVHKFAAGHRYLSYLEQASFEQEALLRRFADPNFAAYVATEIERARDQGTFMGSSYAAFESYAKGQLATASAISKGNIRPALQPLEKREVILQDDSPRALDWQARSGPVDRVRLVGRNPRPKILLPFTSSKLVSMQLAVFHRKPHALASLLINVHGDTPKVRLTRPVPTGAGLWEARAYLQIRLRTDHCVITELLLEPEQRHTDAGGGLGVGEVVLDPFNVWTETVDG